MEFRKVIALNNASFNTSIIETFQVYNNKNDFLFIGHMRKEKGIDVLLEAWKLYQKINNDNNSNILTFEGNVPPNNDLNFGKIRNVKIIIKFFKDNEYYEQINQSDCIILLYKFGSNSGIPSSVLMIKKN